MSNDKLLHFKLTGTLQFKKKLWFITIGRSKPIPFTVLDVRHIQIAALHDVTLESNGVKVAIKPESGSLFDLAFHIEISYQGAKVYSNSVTLAQLSLMKEVDTPIDFKPLNLHAVMSLWLENAPIANH